MLYFPNAVGDHKMLKVWLPKTKTLPLALIFLPHGHSFMWKSLQQLQELQYQGIMY